MGVEIAGSLHDLEFGQLLSVLTAMEHEGVLELWGLPGGVRIDMHIKQGMLHCIRKNGKSAGPIHITPILQELIHANQGAFEFHMRRVRNGCSDQLSLPLERLLISAHAEYDEQMHHRDVLPDPDQRYVLKPGVELPGHPFLEAAQPYFKRASGTSARELARRLDLPLDRVRYLILKMIRKDWLDPV